MDDSKMKQIVVFIQPTYSATFNECDDDEMSSDDILYQQGYDRDYITVEEDESFEIPSNYEGEIDESEDNSFLEGRELSAGLYKFNGEDVVLIKKYYDDSW